MPLAQIDLSSSHLPSSCSFFLSALSSLGYRCLGQRGKDIAFGIENIEFYIKQQDPRYGPSVGAKPSIHLFPTVHSPAPQELPFTHSISELSTNFTPPQLLLVAVAKLRQETTKTKVLITVLRS